MYIAIADVNTLETLGKVNGFPIFTNNDPHDDKTFKTL